MRTKHQIKFDKLQHFFYGHWINLFVIMISSTVSVWYGLLACALGYAVFEYIQKKRGGTNSFREQAFDWGYSFITAPVYAWAFAQITLFG